MPKAKKDTQQTSWRISTQNKALLEKTAAELGITQAAAIEMAIRAFAKANGVTPEEKH